MSNAEKQMMSPALAAERVAAGLDAPLHARVRVLQHFHGRGRADPYFLHILGVLCPGLGLPKGRELRFVGRIERILRRRRRLLDGRRGGAELLRDDEEDEDNDDDISFI